MSKANKMSLEEYHQVSEFRQLASKANDVQEL